MEPKNEKGIFEKNCHIIDLTQTVDFLKNALSQVHKVITNGEVIDSFNKKTSIWASKWVGKWNWQLLILLLGGML